VRLYPDIYYIFWVRNPRDCILNSHLTDDLNDFGVDYPKTDDVRRNRAISWKYQYDIVRAVRATAAGGSPLDPRIAPIVLTARSERIGPELSGREREVVLLVAEGLSNRAIGERLAITEKTVKSHLTRAFQRLGLKNRAGAIDWVRRMGLAEPQRGDGDLPPAGTQRQR